MSTTSIVVPGRFNGPSRSGNGGYLAGLLGARFDGPAEVTLRNPVPLDTELDVVEAEGGGLRALAPDGLLIAEAAAAPDFALEVPPPLSPAHAHEATAGYRGLADHDFSSCFVCGLARDDGERVFAGPVEGTDLVAAPWTPPAESADTGGVVRPERVWAVLDCPGFFAAFRGVEGTIGFLGRMTAFAEGPVRAGEEHVVLAWPIEVDGRKRIAGTAVYSAAGVPLARSRLILIEPRPA